MVNCDHTGISTHTEFTSTSKSLITVFKATVLPNIFSHRIPLENPSKKAESEFSDVLKVDSPLL